MNPGAPPLHIPGAILADLFDHARAVAPRECCGLLGGQGLRVDSIHRLRNADGHQQAETHYCADPSDLITAVRAIRDRGAEVVAIYHSHPRWAAVPSKTDLRENYWGATLRPIVSLLTDAPTLRVWRLAEDSFAEVPWQSADGPA